MLNFKDINILVQVVFKEFCMREGRFPNDKEYEEIAFQAQQIWKYSYKKFQEMSRAIKEAEENRPPFEDKLTDTISGPTRDSYLKNGYTRKK